MNTVREIQTLNKRELENCVPSSASWHTDYRDTAYIYIGGISFDLTEGDIVSIFSQFGEPVWLKLARDKETGKSKGFAFLKFEDQRSTDLAVDNLGGAAVLGRTLRVDHTRYKKRDDENDEEFYVSVGLPDEVHVDGEKKRHRHHHRRHIEGDGQSGRHHRSRQTKDVMAIEDGYDDEDPMKDYLARREKERHEKRGKQRRRSTDRHHENHTRQQRT